MINICRFFKHKRFEKEYREAIEECEALKLENEELYRILADLKEERKLKDKYKQECEELKVAHDKAQDILGRIDKANELKSLTIQKLAKQCEELQKQLEFVRTHRTVIDAEKDHYRKECEDLKKKLNTSEEWRIKAESLNEKQDLENTRYRKALEEIEEVWEKDKDGDYDFVKWQILNIINEAKGGNNENT